jgi:hypothetical protein
MDTVSGLAIGQHVNVTGTVRSDGGLGSFTVIGISGNAVALKDDYLKCPPFFGIPGVPCNSIITVSIPNGGFMSVVTSQPSTIAGITTNPFTVPAPDSTVTVDVDRPYLGIPGQVVWIGTDSYSIVAVPPPGSGTTLTLINLSDTTTTTYASLTFPLDLLSVPELPAGRMGTYVMGQNWMSLVDGQSFIFSDPVGAGSGTTGNQGRDAVLKTTLLTFKGGALRLPNSGEVITAMIGTATLDASLGQGALQVGTERGFFSVLVPFDPTQAEALSTGGVTPILTQSLIGRGPLGQNSTVQVNNDTLFRSLDGFASLVLARREFNTWGNVPISREVVRALSTDTRSLLSYGSAAVFDNRFVATCAPTSSPQGVYHNGLVALNFDALSNLRTKAPACYDGLWTGIKVLQLVSGAINGTVRGFSFINNTDEKAIQLYELTPSSAVHTDLHYDINDIGPVNIVASVESPVLFGGDVKPLIELIQLRDGEIYIRDLVIGHDVNIVVEYRPDFYPCWIPWATFTVCAKDAGTNSQPGYRMRLGLGQPSPDFCEEGNNRPLRIGNFFQVRVTWTGHLEFMGLKAMACSVPQTQFAPILCEPSCEDLTLPIT